MQVRIHGNGVDLDPRFRDWADGRIRRSLRRFGHRIRHVELQISDVNGPKGGPDKRGRCVVHVSGRPTLVVETWSEQRRDLVDRLARRVGPSVGRSIGRRRDASRRRAA